LTDPPYEIRAGNGGGVFGKRDSLVNTGGFTDSGVNYSFLDTFNSWFCFCSLSQLSELLKKSYSLCEHTNLLSWCKPNPLPTCCNKYLPDVEFIVHGFKSKRLFGDYKTKSSFHLHPCGNKETKHPNEKPIPVIHRLLRLGSLDGETVLDPFLGSGTTAVACEQLNRRWIGIEISEKYCEIAAKRIERERQQLKLFGPVAERPPKPFQESMF